MNSSNPALSERVAKRIAEATSTTGPMTAMGTATKTLVLLAVLSISSGITWAQVAGGDIGFATTAMVAGSLGGFVVALLTIFNPSWARITAPIYASLEGLALGGISAVVNAKYHGLPQQAVAMTLGTALVMFALYRSRVITVTDRVRSVATTALLGLVGVYLLNIVLSLFGHPLSFMTDSSPLSIGLSLFACGLAAFFLLLDMDQIERMVAQRAPKEMEWYGAFSFLVTLVWLYLEILRVLQKLRK